MHKLLFRMFRAIATTKSLEVSGYGSRMVRRLDIDGDGKPNSPVAAASIAPYEHHRPGFYVRGLPEGEVGAGDHIVKIADGPERMSVADVDALARHLGVTRGGRLRDATDHNPDLKPVGGVVDAIDTREANPKPTQNQPKTNPKPTQNNNSSILFHAIFHSLK